MLKNVGILVFIVILLVFSSIVFGSEFNDKQFNQVQLETSCANKTVIMGYLKNHKEIFSGVDEQRKVTTNKLRVFTNDKVNNFIVLMDIQDYGVMCVISVGDDYTTIFSNYNML